MSLATANLTPELEEEMTEQEKTEVLVYIENEKGLKEIQDEFPEMVEFEISNYVKINATSQEINELNQENYTGQLEPNHIFETTIRDSNVQINNFNYQMSPKMGENTSIAVLDTGIDEHTFLNIKNHRDYTGNGIGDNKGHGTHVAGIIGSQHPIYRGVSPRAEINDLKVLDENGQGTATSILRGMEWVIRNDIDVASLSLGSTMENCDGTDAISRIATRAHEKGVTVVAAAGNTGPENNTVMSPGCAQKPITVGAIDSQNQIAHYSGRGDLSNEVIKPDVVAPGTEIISTGPDNGWRRLTGTSMATPHVTGQAAILKSQNQELDNKDLKEIIKTTSDDLGYPENYQGSGRINLGNSSNSIANLTYYRGVQLEPRRPIWKRFREMIWNFFRL